MVSHAHRIRDDGERRVHGRAGWEEATVNYIQIVDVVSFAVDVKRRSLRIMAEADSTVLMSDPGEWNALTHIQIAREQSLVAPLTVN